MVAGFVWATFGRSFFDWGVWLRLASPIFERSIFGAAVPNRSLGATFAPRNQKRRMRMTYPVFFLRWFACFRAQGVSVVVASEGRVALNGTAPRNRDRPVFGCRNSYYD